MKLLEAVSGVNDATAFSTRSESRSQTGRVEEIANPEALVLSKLAINASCYTGWGRRVLGNCRLLASR